MPYPEIFTFHNVSINSKIKETGNLTYVDLHSTMFLLIHFLQAYEPNARPPFTFHNVSINSMQELYNDMSFIIFTFHNVSINSIN